MMRWRLLQTLVICAVLLIPTLSALADDPVCTFNVDGSITCTVTGNGDGSSSEGEPQDVSQPTACAEGEIRANRIIQFEPESGGSCTRYEEVIDTCTGTIMEAGDIDYGVTCPQQTQPPAANHPCDTLTVSPSGVTCDARDGWHISVTLPFPVTYLDVRPFPATLVRWPTAIRNGGQLSGSNSGGQNYFGSGSKNNPRLGDWSNIRLTLTLNPASPMFVTLPKLPKLTLSDGGATGNPVIIQWEVPSHPAAGGGPLARTVPGLDELPGDMPLFVGSGRSAYHLFWNLSYSEYEAIEECLPGPDINSNYDCDQNTGHKEVTGYDWRNHSRGGEIPPSAVAGLPASVAADLNNDGVVDAYWDTNLTLRRMDNAGSVNNPTYRRSWNWGGLIYWAVREGQGQIGWPDGQ